MDYAEDAEAAEHYELTVCFESPDIENADFVFDMVSALMSGFEHAHLVQVSLATIHPTFEGDQIREETDY